MTNARKETTTPALMPDPGLASAQVRGSRAQRRGESRSAPTWPMGAYYFFFFGGLGVLVPYLPLWLEQNGFRGLAMSAIAALIPLLSFFGPPLAGLFSDARGARGNLLGAATALSALALGLLGVAQAMGASQSFLVVFPLMMGFAACRSSLILLADRIALELGGHYGRRRLWGSAGFLIVAGAFGAGSAILREWTPAVAAVLFSAGAVMSRLLPQVSAAPRSPPLAPALRLLRQPRFVLFLACACGFRAGHVSYELCGSLHFRDLGASGDVIGLLWMTGVAAEIALFYVSGSLLARFSPERLLVFAYAFGALRWWLTARLPEVVYVFPVQLLHGVTFGVTWLASLTYVRRAAGAEQAGSAQGLLMAAQAAGGGLGMLAWGPVYEAWGGRVVFVAAGLTSGVTALVALAYLGGATRAERLGGA